jgi:hypothetical protein
MGLLVTDYKIAKYYQSFSLPSVINNWEVFAKGFLIKSKTAKKALSGANSQ